MECIIDGLVCGAASFIAGFTGEPHLKELIVASTILTLWCRNNKEGWYYFYIYGNFWCVSCAVLIVLEMRDLVGITCVSPGVNLGLGDLR